MNVKHCAIAGLSSFLMWAACSVAVDAPKVPSADDVKSVVIMTRVSDGHPQVAHVENHERIAQIVDFVAQELSGWYVPIDGDGKVPITSVAFEGHDGQILYHLFVGDDWVSADDDTVDSACNQMARVDLATVERLKLLLGPDGV